MTGLFNPPIVAVNTSLDPDQRARSAALLVAAQARPGTSVTDLLRLAEYIFEGRVQRDRRPSPFDLIGEGYNNEAGLRGELRDFGQIRVPAFQSDPDDGGDGLD